MIKGGCNSVVCLYLLLRLNILMYFHFLLHQLLRKNPERRLGSSQRDAEDIKKQPFYKDMKWDSLLHRKLKAPFIPTVKHAEDVSNFDVEFTSEDPVLTPPRERKTLSTNDQVLYWNYKNGFMITRNSFFFSQNISMIFYPPCRYVVFVFFSFVF